MKIRIHRCIERSHTPYITAQIIQSKFLQTGLLENYRSARVGTSLNIVSPWCEPLTTLSSRLKRLGIVHAISYVDYVAVKNFEGQPRRLRIFHRPVSNTIPFYFQYEKSNHQNENSKFQNEKNYIESQ